MSDAADVWAGKISTASNKNRRRHIYCRGDDLRALMGPVDDLPEALLEARAQKAALVWFRTRLIKDLRVSHDFGDKTGIGWMDKLLTAARLKELAGVKIAKAGKSGGLRYDIAGLQATHYGRKILESIGFNKRRTSVNKEEYATVVRAFQKIKLTLPQTVSPTTTERFFSGEDSA